MPKDKEIIAAMNLIKEYCKGRICQACACWNSKDKRCIVAGNTEPCGWETEKATELD